jgi:carbonic anhydrase/acetyltransferase-like protein (isoleucine patch superfamily)
MSLEANAASDHLQVEATAYVHPTAVIIGNVQIGPGVFVGPHAVVRADEPGPNGTVSPIIIGREANIQDGVILHALGGTSVEIGPGTSVAHGAVIHGPCATGAGCFIGFNSVIYNAVLREQVMVMHQAVVEGVTIEDGLCVPSATAVCEATDALRLREASADVLALAAKVCRTNIRLAQAYRGRNPMQ